MSALAIMLTRRCNMACAHCSVESGPKVDGKGPTLEELLGTIRDAAEEGVDQINLTGGEPMLRERALLAMLRECCRLGIGSRITTNGFWGRDPDRAHRTLGAFLDAGLGGLTVSYDRFHAAFQGPEPVVNIARAAESLGFRIDVNVTRLADDQEVEGLVAPFSELPTVRLRFYDVQPVGAARHLPGGDFRSETEGFCSACGIPAVTDDGRVTACNGPAYFESLDSPLAVGSLEEAPLGELLARHRDDPILDTIRTTGPGGLRDALREIPGFESFPRDDYGGMCDLCRHITSSPEAVTALRSVLSSPDRVVARVARQRLIDEERAGKSMSRAYANSEGAARTFLALASGQKLADEVASRVLGRADLDWRARAEWLIAAGLARPMLSRLEEPVLSRWAPTLFGSLLEHGAVADEARELAQRASLEHAADVLRAKGATGIVVGGAAHWRWDGADSGTRRAVPRIEIVLSDRSRTEAVRARLEGDAGFPGVSVRASIVPQPWGVPEADILSRACPIADPALAGLRRIAPPDALVCALVGASAAGLRAGLETGWDLLATLAEERVDVERVAALVAVLPAPRAFWVPARVFAERIGVPLPAELLGRAPDDERQQRLERVAARRLFRSGSGTPIAEWSFRWTWPVLAAGTASDFRRRLPASVARATREFPSAWREVGGDGMAHAVREARRIVATWSSGGK